jgi:hypothetical protein
MEAIISNDSPRMQSHEATDILSAATALYTNSSDGRRALSSTMFKSEDVIDLFLKSKARHSLSGEAFIVFLSELSFAERKYLNFLKELSTELSDAFPLYRY